MDRVNKNCLKSLKIGDMVAELPIIQGGMGVGISRSSLAGAVAAEGGVGIISTAQIGYDEEGFEKDQAGCNLRAIRKHILKAREIAHGRGLIGVNIMVALICILNTTKLYPLCSGIICNIRKNLVTCKKNFLLYSIFNRNLKDTRFYFFKF